MERFIRLFLFLNKLKHNESIKMEPIEDIVGMGPLSDFELDGYLSLMDQLIAFPDSIRNFDQFHQASLKILKERGRTRKKIATDLDLLFQKKGEKWYRHKIPDKKVSLSITYSHRQILPTSDVLQVNYFDGRDEISDPQYIPGKSARLVRERGHLTIKRFEQEDDISLSMRGVNPIEIVKGLFQYQPKILVINAGGLNERSLTY